METIVFKKEGHKAFITISRPKSLNALNNQVLEELDATIDEIQKDKDIYSVIITGAGKKAFVAGACIEGMKDLNVKEAREFSIYGNKVFRKIEKLRMPTIAALNGFTLGGGLELALVCDIRIASENAVLGFPETSLGITPGYGGTQRLARVIGLSKAKKMLFTAEKIKADEAEKIGLVEKVVDKDNLMSEVEKIADKIGHNAPIAVSLCKASLEKGINCDISTAIEIESEIFAQCFATSDQKDAMSAFVNKTKLEKFNNK